MGARAGGPRRREGRSGECGRTCHDARRLPRHAGPAPDPLEVADVNCKDSIDIDDIVYLITYIFAGGPEPCAGCP